MYFQNESYIPQLFTRKFSRREPKCLNGVAVEVRDSPFLEPDLIKFNLSVAKTNRQN